MLYYKAKELQINLSLSVAIDYQEQIMTDDEVNP